MKTYNLIKPRNSNIKINRTTNSLNEKIKIERLGN